MKKILISAFLALVLVGCTQVEGLAVGPEDNGFACIKGETNAVGGLVGGNVSGVRVELPAGVDTSTWTAEDFRAIAEVCD